MFFQFLWVPQSYISPCMSIFESHSNNKKSWKVKVRFDLLRKLSLYLVVFFGNAFDTDLSWILKCLWHFISGFNFRNEVIKHWIRPVNIILLTHPSYREFNWLEANWIQAILLDTKSKRLFLIYFSSYHSKFELLDQLPVDLFSILVQRG